MTREERIAQAAPLKAQGLTYREIAERLGVSLQTVKRCFSDRSYETDRRLSREAKRRRTGICEDCGAVTRYTGHGQDVSPHCVPCGKRRGGLAQRGRGKVGEVLAYLDQPRRYSEIRDHFGMTSQYLSQMLYGRLLRRGDVVRLSRGVYQRAD
jgi:hypothetical protein